MEIKRKRILNLKEEPELLKKAKRIQDSLTADNLIKDSSSESKEKFGILITGIPESLKITQIKKNLKGQNSFMPKYKNIHMGLVYIIFFSEEERELNHRILTEKFSNTNFISYNFFSTGSENSSEDAAKIFLDISKSFYNIIPNRGAVLVNDLDQKMKLSKEKAILILSNNYIQVKSSLEALKIKRGSGINFENNIQASKWFILYYIFWFILKKLSVHSFSNHEFLFQPFVIGENLSFFNCLDFCNPIVRIYVCDIFFQLLYLENQFQNQDLEVLDSIKALVTKCEVIISISEFSQEYFEIFKEILKQDMIKKHFKFLKKNTYYNFIEEALSNTYLVRLPDFLHGITLFNRCILIKFKGNKSIYDKNLFYWGYTLYVIIHELGHYRKRYEYTTDIEWLEFSTPQRFNLQEAGSILEFQLFGKVLNFFNTSTAEFLLNINNWKLPPEVFKKKFSKANKYIKDLTNDRENIQIRLLKSSNLNFIEIGPCSKAMQRRSKRNPFFL